MEVAFCPDKSDRQCDKNRRNRARGTMDGARGNTARLSAAGKRIFGLASMANEKLKGRAISLFYGVVKVA